MGFTDSMRDFARSPRSPAPDTAPPRRCSLETSLDRVAPSTTRPPMIRRPELAGRSPIISFRLARSNPVSRNLLDYYLPGTSLAAGPAMFTATHAIRQNDDQGGLRFDAAVSTRHQLSAQIFRQSAPSDKPGLYPLSGLLYANEGTLAEAQHVWTLSPQAVNSLRISFLRNVAIGGNEGQGLGPILDSIGITNTFERSGVTAINLQGYSPFGRANGQVGNRDNTWQLGEEFAYVRARHNFAFGVGFSTGAAGT